ncbi:NAD(P)-binding protein [Penicillium atrosanguineum]|uniref:NAD(P)-binding protein n=1 Tax=Penicillium atrosanguineum TaxID=1132637 RepID=A0A9W9TYT4_9EURO|nr:uncharacterized protein N7443_007200 [Penicillium atrosanguineum]KAJ5119315.1 NAD(P)-binding protein [Penicillium atrosanguineum]KAJ5296307.1 hypothetical protein N7443_007200 [Penicillium atrosanguineum]KAJ5299076.1 NAD(P)-binding protein [Penicillium atrosanguineum]
MQIEKKYKYVITNYFTLNRMSGKTILVIGANKGWAPTPWATFIILRQLTLGIGLAIVQRLAVISSKDTIILGCRDKEKGLDAIQLLRAICNTKAHLDVVCIDIESEASVQAAAKEVREKHKRLDVLVNNAAIALLEKDADIRDVYGKVFASNVGGVISTCEAFLPLMRDTSADARIIQVSSARGSLTRIAEGKMPPARVVSYGASKAALNCATLELVRREENRNVLFQMVSPGHCRTDFNNNTGKKDPLDGALVVEKLLLEERDNGRPCGMWEIEGDNTEPQLVPW